MRKFDDSAQLLLLAAFAIGFTLVVSTIMLSNIIYASNMASESTTDISNYEISNIAQMTDEATRAAYNSSNATEFVQYMDNYEREISSLYAYNGLSVYMDHSNLSDAYFTENGLYDGNPDWIVAKNVNRTDLFTIELTNTSKLGNASNSFEVQVINQSGTTWFMKVYNDSANINITVNNNTNSLALSKYMMLNITGNAPIFFDFDTSATTEPYMIKFLNSSNAMGHYTISGGLADGSDYVEKRSWIINTTINIASTNNKLNVSMPVTVP